MEYMLDHEAMRWGRSLTVGDAVTIQATPPIKAVVKHVRPWRERTQLRLVMKGNDQADLKLGQRVPLVIYLPDIVPGLAVRSLAPLATKVAITTPETARWFGERSVVTGYPVRRALAAPKSKAAARASFALPPDASVLLVTGGSLGAHSLNEAIGTLLPDYLKLAHVIHVHGKSDGDWLTVDGHGSPGHVGLETRRDE